MDKKPNKIHKNLIPTINKNHIVQYCINSYITINTNIASNFLAASWLNSEYTFSYASI